MNSIVDRSKVAVIHFAKIFKGMIPGRIQLSNLEDRFWNKLLAMPPRITSSFLKHVVGIILRCSKEEVIRVNAMSNVALMTNKFSFRNFSPVNNPGLAMGTYRMPCSWNMKHPSAIAKFCSSPKPACFTFENMLKENLLYWLRRPFPFKVAWRAARIVVLDKCGTVKTLFCQMTYSMFHLDTSVGLMIQKEVF